MAGALSTNGEKRNAYRLLTGKSEGKRLLVRAKGELSLSRPSRILGYGTKERVTPLQ
jgi:hypothetical protein